jgi:hypothetical protein
MPKIFVGLLFLVIVSSLQAQIDTIRIFVRSGDLTLFDGIQIHQRIFTTSESLERNSTIFVLEQNEPVYLRLINYSNENHGLKIDGLFEIPSTLPGDSSGLEFSFPDTGVFRYYDPSSTYQDYLGLSGIMHVKSSGDLNSYFYWDIREFQKEWNSIINDGFLPDPLTYSPQYFTINGNSGEDINQDPLAKIIGNVGQEIRLIIVNNGRSIHSMHFHGYHATILNSSKESSHVNRLKDSFPIFPDHSLVLSFVPDKPGEYPVHDHNLVAVTGGGLYHAGMITTLVIAP